MELQREIIAHEAISQDVDLKKMFTETIIGIMAALREETGISHESVRMLHRIRELGFEGLSQARWAEVLEMDVEEPSYVAALEWLIRHDQAVCRIDNASELQTVIKKFRKRDSHSASLAFFLEGLAHTAVSQALNKRGIIQSPGYRESCSLQKDLQREYMIMVAVVREEINALLATRR